MSLTITFVSASGLALPIRSNLMEAIDSGQATPKEVASFLVEVARYAATDAVLFGELAKESDEGINADESADHPRIENVSGISTPSTTATPTTPMKGVEV